MDSSSTSTLDSNNRATDALEIVRARGISTWAAVFTAHAGRYDRMAKTLGTSYFLSKSGDIETDATALLRDWLAHDSRLAHMYLQPAAAPQTSILVGVNDALIAYLATNPDALHTLDPRKFEEIVADLWHQFGYKVQLTPRTRDGGKDTTQLRPYGTYFMSSNARSMAVTIL